MHKNLLIVNFLIFTFILTAIGWTSQALIYPLWGKKHFVERVDAAETATTEAKPPQITDISIDELSATSTTITWKTDKPADSMINYNISRDYGTVRDPFATTTHKLVIPELLSSQQYYFRVFSTDPDGNQSLSNDLTFVTKEDQSQPKPEKPEENPLEETKPGYGEGEGGNQPLPQEQQEIVNKVVELLDKVSSEDGLSLIESKLDQEAQEKAAPPVITGDFAKVDVTADAALISWKTDKEANSIVQLASESEYNPQRPTVYAWNQGNPNEMVKEHQVLVRGLKAATTYHYRVASKSALDLESVSEDNTFKTKSILPEIFNAMVSKVQEDSATIEFTTNVPSSVVIEYTDLNTNTTKLAGSPVFVAAHSVVLKDLKFDTYYSAVIKVENEQGEKTASDPLTFTTTRDIVAPVISSVNAKSTLDQSSDKTQTIISWRTDESSVCQFFYNRGLAAEEAKSMNKEEDYTTNHVQVVVDFQMATVYKYWIECFDKTGNKVKSDNYTILTPVREESILDIIIKNFEGTFGWAKKK